MKTIKIEPITRIEGHARVTLDLDDNDEIRAGSLQVLEIRGFEKLLQGMELLKMPMVTARICGVCPAAHHLAAVAAIEQGLGIKVPKAASDLRELLYLGHILHSHALSCFVLIGPDLLAGIGAPPQNRSIFSVLQAQPEIAKKALRLRSIGQQIVETIGGRGIHPVTAIAGGMSCAPNAEKWARMALAGQEALGLIGDLRPALDKSIEALKDVRAAAPMALSCVALSKNSVVDFLGGECNVVDSTGKLLKSFDPTAYADNFIEHVMPGSYMKSVQLRGNPQQSFLVGPLARAIANERFSTPQASALLNEFKKSAQGISALDNISARVIEMVYCAERIIELTSAGIPAGDLATPVMIKAGRYIGMVEAPRGILVHDYTANDQGQVTDVNMIVATQNNYNAINSAITDLARYFKTQKNDELLMNGVEFAVRCFDPCLACATHALGKMPMTLELFRKGTFFRTISREVNNAH